jgi:hypothetical protein
MICSLRSSSRSFVIGLPDLKLEERHLPYDLDIFVDNEIQISESGIMNLDRVRYTLQSRRSKFALVKVFVKTPCGNYFREFTVDFTFSDLRKHIPYVPINRYDYKSIISKNDFVGDPFEITVLCEEDRHFISDSFSIDVLGKEYKNFVSESFAIDIDVADSFEYKKRRVRDYMLKYGYGYREAWEKLFPDFIAEHTVDVYSFEGMYAFRIVSSLFGEFYSDPIYLTHSEVVDSFRQRGFWSDRGIPVSSLLASDPNDPFEFTNNYRWLFLTNRDPEIYGSQSIYSFSTSVISSSGVVNNGWVNYLSNNYAELFGTDANYSMGSNYILFENPNASHGTETRSRIVDNTWIAGNPVACEWLSSVGLSPTSTERIYCNSRLRIQFIVGNKMTNAYIPKAIYLNFSTDISSTCNIQLVRVGDPDPEYQDN